MEFVFVVPRRELFPECYPQGLLAFGDVCRLRDFEGVVRRHGFFVEREHAERTPALKQVIPYTVLVRDGQVLLLRRLAGGGESRLHHKLSIGVGGHINPVDATEDEEPSGSPRPRGNPISAASERELHEELIIEGTLDIRAVGMLNDDSNPVGAVHVGHVQVALVEGSVAIREKDAMEGQFVPPSRLRQLLAEGAPFETWSKALVERLDELLPHPHLSPPDPAPPTESHLQSTLARSHHPGARTGNS